jgi:hypothetical protein
MSDFITPKNVVLLIDPRNISTLFIVLDNVHYHLQDDWKYIFYCGKSVYDEWFNVVPYYIELRKLDVDNFTSSEYSFFLKSRKLWSELEGEYVLTIQLDTWILNEYPYTIDYFIKQNRSYIGGNMPYAWKEFIKLGLNPSINNFNGGLSLRKREDMIYIIDYFTNIQDDFISNLAEDVFFAYGCYELDFKTGDNIESLPFAVQFIYCEKRFGIHNVSDVNSILQIHKKYPYLLSTNPYVYNIQHEQTHKKFDIQTINKKTRCFEYKLQIPKCIYCDASI